MLCPNSVTPDLSNIQSTTVQILSNVLIAINRLHHVCSLFCCAAGTSIVRNASSHLSDVCPLSRKCLAKAKILKCPHVQAGDPDLGGVLEFSLLAGDTDTFQLDRSTGALSLKQPVDREQRDLYRLTIRLSDSVHNTDISQILLVSTAWLPKIHDII
jgi:hypothetical protein